MDIFLVNRKVFSESESLYNQIGKVFRDVWSNIVLKNGCDFLAWISLASGTP